MHVYEARPPDEEQSASQGAGTNTFDDMNRQHAHTTVGNVITV